MRKSLLSLLLAAGAALAARPADAVPAAREADLGKKQVSAPDASLAGSIEARGASAEPAGPRLDFETFRYAVEVQVSGKRREEISDLDQLIKLGGSESEMPAWLFRVAELHWEEAQYLFFESNRRDDAILAAKGDPSRVERLKVEKRDLDERSKAEQAEAIARYREIARRFPQYPRLDEVVFFLGENLWKQNRRREALEAYKVLITRFPKSKFVPDAWMAFGEHYFDSAEKGDRKESLKKALESYKRAAAYQESSVYGYAIYKQAWVHYNLGAFGEALDLFRAVIFFGDLPTSTVAPDKKLALAREARKDYVRTYSHVGDPRAAFDDFARVGGKDARDMLKSLAGLYFDEGKDHDAILVYHGLIAAEPASPEAPLFQGRIVTCAGRMGKKDLAVQQATRFVEMLKESEKRGGDDKAKQSLADARKDAENTLRTLAVQYHAEFKKTREDAVAALAAELYRLHLEVFPDSRYAYEMRFFHAELLYALEKFEEAGEEYTRVAEIDIRRQKEPGPDGKPQAPGKYLADALESAVQAFDVVAKRAESSDKRPAGEGKGRLAIPREKQKLVDACERYLAHAPKGDKRVEVAYKAANVYYRYNAFPEAVKLFTEIAEAHPTHELARYAANLALDCLNLQGDWRGMNALARRFWDDQPLMRAQPPLREDLAKVIEQSAFKVVEELERADRPVGAAEAYVAFVRDWPGSKLAPTALFNASVDLVKAGRLERAMSVRDELMQRYPNDPLVPKIVFTNAQDREAVADFARAADDYERYFHGWRHATQPAPAAVKKPARGKHPPPPPPSGGDAGGYEEAKARDALYNAGVLREGLGEYGRAEADRTAFVESWPESSEAPKVFLSVADLYRLEGQPAKEERQLEAYQERFAKDPTEWLTTEERIARLHGKAGQAALERRAYEEALKYYQAHKSQVGERALPVVAWAEYLALEPAFETYERIDFAVPGRLSPPHQVKWLKERLQLKGARLLELQKSYTAVVERKQAEAAVCALYKIGLGYKRFAQALQAAPLPPEIRHNQALAEEYRNQLRQLAEAPEKKSVEALEYAMTKSRELGVSNECSKAATEVLVNYKPDLYGPPPEKTPALALGASVARPAGHGLVSTLVRPAPAETSPAAEAASAAHLPPGAAQKTAAAAPRPVEGRDPDLPPEDDRPAKAPPKPAASPVTDEDLLP
ncbi:MAG TPA: tetratricopeptide repeat protein [Anaeromyxobacteraceae bacterium]|nr:tetratricopeptide repeat protein [Anaeromyxobacteraceae bacterium]